MLNPEELSRLMSAKRRLVKVIEVPASKDQRFQVTRRRNGVFLFGCMSKLDVEAYLYKTSVETLIGGTVISRRSTR